MTRAYIILNFFIMKKQILNLGKALTKAEQRLIHGGIEEENGCSVSCGSGYYACCNDNVITVDRCLCYPVSQSHTCQAGGTGSNSCSVAIS